MRVESLDSILDAFLSNLAQKNYLQIICVFVCDEKQK